MAESGLAFTEPNLPWIESPFFSENLQQRAQDDAERKMATFYHENGYWIIENAISNELLERIKFETNSLFNPALADGPRSRYRCQDGWKESSAIKELASDQKILNTLEYLYGRKPIPFQTLNFKHGTQQRAHSDSIHFSSMPARFMCGVWVAIEDITEENGPLFYYPGSHKLPEYNYLDIGISCPKTSRFNSNVNGGTALSLDAAARYKVYEDFNERLMRTLGLKQKRLVVPKGTALIWASNLVHGGSEILSPNTTRWSQVTHYFFEDCIYYTPMFSNPISGEYLIREIVNISTGKLIKNNYNGVKIYKHLTDFGRQRVSFEPVAIFTSLRKLKQWCKIRAPFLRGPYRVLRQLLRS